MSALCFYSKFHITSA